MLQVYINIILWSLKAETTVTSNYHKGVCHSILTATLRDQCSEIPVYISAHHDMPDLWKLICFMVLHSLFLPYVLHHAYACPYS